jgi:hypothetical protein
MNRSQQIPFSRRGAGILDRCRFAWNKRIDMPWKIMSIGKLEWAYRSWSTRLGIRPLAGRRSIAAFLRPDLRGHKACRFVEAGGPSSYAGALQSMQSPPLGSDHVLSVGQHPRLGRLIGHVTTGSGRDCVFQMNSLPERPRFRATQVEEGFQYGRMGYRALFERLCTGSAR